MKRYTIEVTDAAMAAIHAQARYIAVEQAQPVNAQSWLGAVWDAIDAFETFPRTHPIAEVWARLRKAATLASWTSTSSSA